MTAKHHDGRGSTNRLQHLTILDIDRDDRRVSIDITPKAGDKIVISEIYASLQGGAEVARVFEDEEVEIRRFRGHKLTPHELICVTAKPNQ